VNFLWFLYFTHPSLRCAFVLCACAVQLWLVEDSQGLLGLFDPKVSAR
jgi:hypothetical protein